MPAPLPALCLIAVPGRRRRTIELAQEVERRGFAGIYVPSIFSNMAQAVALAVGTNRIRFATAITPIYGRVTEDFAQACDRAGVSVRPYPPDGARVSIGDHEANDAFLAAARAYPRRH